MRTLLWVSLMTLLISTGNAVAQSNVVSSASPTSANIVVDVFETVGYKAQEAVINYFDVDLRRIGVLLWIIAVMASLGAFIFSQDTRTAIWLFLGPTFFLLAIGLSTDGKRVEWRFRADPNTVSPYETNQTYKVSWLFHEMNRIISGAYLSLIETLTGDAQAKNVQEFMTREKLLASLLSHRPTDSGLLALSRDVIVGCGRDLEDARIVGAGYRDPTFRRTGEYLAAQKRYEERKLSPTYHTIQSDVALRFVEELLTKPTLNTGEGWNARCMNETAATLADRGLSLGQESSPKLLDFLSTPQTCQRLWCWMSVGFQSDVEEVIKSKELDSATLERLRKELAEKLTQKEYIADAMDPSGKTPLGGKRPIDPDPSLVPVVISGYLIRETMKELGIEGFSQAAFSEKAGLELPTYQRDRNFSQEMSQYASQQSMQYRISQVQQTDIFIFASTLPYFQGLFLYTLSLLYPFFTLLLLSPNRVKFFTTFFLFWAWVKSWDIGFALVTQIESILWQFFPHSGYYDPQLDPDHGPASVLAAAFDGDPAYGLGTYYTIVGTLLSAVPIITGQIFVGAYASVLSHLMKGLQALSQGVASSVQAATAVRQISALDALRENSVIADVMAKTDISKSENWGSPVIGQAVQSVIGQLDNVYNQLSERLKVGGDKAQISGEELRQMLVGQSTLGQAASQSMQLAGSRNQLSVADTRLAVARMRNGMKMAITQANVSYNYFNTFAGSQKYEHYNAIRAALTGRREHWNFPSNPANIEKDLQLAVISQFAQLQSQLAALDSQENRAFTKP